VFQKIKAAYVLFRTNWQLAVLQSSVNPFYFFKVSQDPLVLRHGLTAALPFSLNPRIFYELILLQLPDLSSY